MKKVCETCRFFYKEPSELPHIFGECRIRSVDSFPQKSQGKWCGEWREKLGGPENYVKLTIQDNKTGKVAHSGPRVFHAPRPGQIMIWDFRTDIILSNDFSIRVSWPLKMT